MDFQDFKITGSSGRFVTMGTLAYSGGLEAEPPVGVRGQSPPEADEIFVFKTVIFNPSAAILHETMYCLSCFLCG